MKFMVVCMLALVATSMAGESKKEKRGLLGLGDASFYSAPAVYNAAPVVTKVSQHTHTVERVNVPVPYAVDRTIIKHVPVDRPVPQPYPVEVIKKVPHPVYIDRPVPQPYAVHVNVPVAKPYAVPVDRVQTVIQHVPVPTPVDRHIPQPYPVYVNHHPAAAHYSYSSPVSSVYRSW